MPSSKPPSTSRYLFIAGAVLAALVTTLLVQNLSGWPREAAFMAGILVLAAVLWVSEALPLFATALLVITLEVILLANPGGWPGLGFASGENPPFQQILQNAADPVLLLFFGGFLLARAAEKEGVDQAVSAVLLKPFGSRPEMLLLGILCVTLTFSMWMSNTATAAMMMAFASPILAQTSREDPFRKAVILAVPVAANIGGMSTPISSPPNAVAIGFIKKAGYTVGFFDWMVISFPVMGALLLLAWLVLWRCFPSTSSEVKLQHSTARFTGRAIGVIVIFSATVLLWVSEPLHGLPSSVVALLAAIALTVSGIIGRHDLNTLAWNIIILIAGGIALGVGMQLTGLDRHLTTHLGESVSAAWLIPGLIVATLLIGTFMSNTAAANLLLPIGISAASVTGSPVPAAIAIALTASIGMALPVSTPPNAIAYATGEIETRDLMLIGSIVGAAGAAAVSIAVRFL